MATTNPITGDSLISKTLTEEGEKNYEAIFGKKKKTNGGWTPPDTSWDDNRVDIIGQNGNTGEHYDATSESTD